MEMTQNKRRLLALLAGSSLILMAVLAGIGYGYAFETLYVKGETAATFQQFIQSPSLVIWVVATFSGVLLLDVLVGWVLYGYFFSINSRVSMWVAVLRWGYAVWLGGALLPLLPLLNAEAKLGSEEVMGYLERFLTIWSQGLIVFGVHLFGVGYLILKSPKMPRWLGVLVCFAGVCYVGIHSFRQVVADFSVYCKQLEAILSIPMALAELSLAVWLLVKGEKS